MAGRLAFSLSLSLAFSLALSPALPGSSLAAGAADSASQPTPRAPAIQPYVPGLGDFMTAYVQPHHIKLWLAVNAGNWTLATYEADELGETFDDISNYQATWKSVPVAQLIKEMIEPALKSVDAAIAAKDAGAFKPAYAALTAACNSCHKKAQHGFLVIKVPTADSFPDQSFSRR
jgi:hypothetical protein